MDTKEGIIKLMSTNKEEKRVQMLFAVAHTEHLLKVIKHSEVSRQPIGTPCPCLPLSACLSFPYAAVSLALQLSLCYKDMKDDITRKVFKEGVEEAISKLDDSWRRNKLRETLLHSLSKVLFTIS